MNCFVKNFQNCDNIQYFWICLIGWEDNGVMVAQSRNDVGLNCKTSWNDKKTNIKYLDNS